MDSDPDLPPPRLTSPVIDEQGRLTYVGTDGRRYVVLGPKDQEAYRQRSLQQSLDLGARQLREIERHAQAWLDQVCGPGLKRAEALALLLRSLEEASVGPMVRNPHHPDGPGRLGVAWGRSRVERIPRCLVCKLATFFWAFEGSVLNFSGYDDLRRQFFPFDAEVPDLEHLFAEYGQVKQCSLPLDRETGRKRGFAFVEMANEADEAKAIADLQDVEWMGRNIRVNKAEPRGGGGGGGGGRGGYGGGGGGGGGRY